MEGRTLILDAAGPSAAQYIALPVGRYRLSLLPWDNNGKDEPSAFSTTKGKTWVSEFYIMVLKSDGSWSTPCLIGNGGRYETREAAFRCFEEAEWVAAREGCEDVIVAAIVYIPAGRQLSDGDSQGKMHIRFRPIPSGKGVQAS